MYKPKTIYSRIAQTAIISHFKKGDTKKLKIDSVPDELFSIKRGCFVSLHKNDGELRGCIGTIDPIEKNLYEEIIRNAIAAAFRDSRFEPLIQEELSTIDISVDILTQPEIITSLDDLDPQIFGIIVTDNNFHRAILLPDIESIDTVEKQLDIVKRKAGLSHVDDNELSIYRFTSTRYH